MKKINKINKIFKNKWFKYLFYFLLISCMTITLLVVNKYTSVSKFVEAIELKTLDFRFKIVHKYNKPNPKVVILSIDDDSLQILENRYGAWPWNRSAYTHAINYMQSGGVDSMAFDLMFLNYQKGNEGYDKELIETIAKNKNVFIAMNFDNRPNTQTHSLPDNLKIKVVNRSKNVDFSDVTFSNYRSIIKEIIDSTSNIGIINFIRDEDSIARRSPVFIKYKNDYYPHLAFKTANNYLKKHENLNINEFVVDKNGEITLGKKKTGESSIKNRKIQLDNNGLMILNWYGPTYTYEYIPFWKIIKSMTDMQLGKKPLITPDYFKDKVVFIGVTATSLFDIKSSPLSKIYPGVELQATAFNNLIDGNPIKKAPAMVNFAICILLTLITAFIVMKPKSTLVSSISCMFLAIIYIALTTFILKNQVWVAVVKPIAFMLSTFVLMYIIKYLLKSRDYEYTYKLATTDGLTNLYNHRYFQENLLNYIEKAKKTETQFSLILIDIDYFKKFNDTYGHQAGDIVLKKVAEILKKSVKTTDFVARYGGEEMVIVLDKTNLDKALSVANRLCKVIAAKPFKLSNELEVGVTISLGVSSFPIHGTNSSELIEFADKGLYRAKLNGRNQVGEIPDYITKAIPEDETEKKA